MRHGLVLLTGLPVTLGHKYLINFALSFLSSLPDGGRLNVLLNSRHCEPVAGHVRSRALEQHFGNQVHFYHYDRDVPQNPTEHPDFWNVWKKLVNTVVPSIGANDLIFASETYGIELAKTLKCEFIPCNVYRQIIDINATKIRKDPITNFHLILPEMQTYFKKTITVFGAESSGKTTLSKRLADTINGFWIPEWAREYLEVVGSEITESKMLNIVHGQYSSQKEVNCMAGKPFIIQDTDLLSTIGYYRIFGLPVPQQLVDLFKDTKSNLYLMMNDQIPFVPDPLRYGGDKRESTMEFWIDLLEEFDCAYHVMKTTDSTEQLIEARRVALDEFEKTCNMRDFVRT